MGMKKILAFTILSLLVVSCDARFLLFNRRKPAQREYRNVAMADGGVVMMAIANQSLAVTLDPSNQLDVSGVVVTAVDLGQAFLVETADPLDRYLPSVQIRPKKDGPLQNIPSPQLDIQMEWSLMPLGPVKVRPLMTNLVGTTTAGSLTEFLDNYSASKGLNILVQATGLGFESQPVLVYQTPASMTLLALAPEALASLGEGQSGPIDTIPLMAISLMKPVLSSMSQTLITMEPPAWPEMSLSAPVLSDADMSANVEAPSDEQAEIVPPEAAAEPPAESQPPSPAIVDEPQPVADAPSVEPATAPEMSSETGATIPVTGSEQSGSLNMGAGEERSILCESGDLIILEGSQSQINLVCRASQFPASHYSETFPPVDPLILGDCPPEAHDRYVTTGPDGNIYRTWHPMTVPLDPNNPNGPTCTFAHEHGDPPHPDAPPPAFGHVAYQAELPNLILSHAAYKVFSHKAGQMTGWDTPEITEINPDWDIQFWVHQESTSLDRLTTRFHSAAFWSRDGENRITEVYYLADTGQAVDKCEAEKVSGPARRIASSCDHAHELWDFGGEVGGAWMTIVQVDVTNPMTHIAGQVSDLDYLYINNTSETICGIGYMPCNRMLPFGSPGSFWLGNMRLLENPNWRWTNNDCPEFFCTDAYGNRVDDNLCSQGTRGYILQRVPPISYIGVSSSTWDRTLVGIPEALSPWMPHGAPGGN